MRRARMITAGGVLLLTLTACGPGETPDAGATDPASEAPAGGATPGSAETPTPTPTPTEAAAATDSGPVLEELTLPAGYEPMDSWRDDELGGDLAYAVSATDESAARSGDVSADIAAFAAAGLSAETKLSFGKAVADDRQDQVVLIQGVFRDADAAAGEFERIRERARVETGSFVDGDAISFAWGNPVMSQINPNTGETIGPVGLSDGTAVLRGNTITVVEVFFADEAAVDPSIMADLVAQVRGD